MRGDGARIGIADAGGYDRYLRAEWALFAAEPARGAGAREVLAATPVVRALDVGCGAGQELRPLLRDACADKRTTDLRLDSPVLASELLNSHRS